MATKEKIVAAVDIGTTKIVSLVGRLNEQGKLEVLGISSETGSTPVAQSALEVSFGLAATRGEWTSAGTFFGAAEAQAQRTGLRRDPADEAFIAPLLQRARRSVRFDVAMVTAKHLTLEQALEQARAWLGAQC